MSSSNVFSWKNYYPKLITIAGYQYCKKTTHYRVWKTIILSTWKEAWGLIHWVPGRLSTFAAGTQCSHNVFNYYTYCISLFSILLFRSTTANWIAGSTDICDGHCYLNSCKTNIDRCCISFPNQECLTAEPNTPASVATAWHKHNSYCILISVFLSKPDFSPSLSQRFCPFKLIVACVTTGVIPNL